MKAIAFNGSPRTQNNTATLLRHALEGARSAGAETELVDLYRYEYRGCISCFRCKKIGAESYGQCAVRDALTPLLAKAAEADVLLLGSPIYFGTETGALRSFMERLLFPYYTYAEAPQTLAPRTLKAALFYTMSVPEPHHAELGYDKLFERNQGFFTRLFGSCEIFLATETLQFTHPENYFCPAVDTPARRKRHEGVFPEECRAAFELGKRLASADR